MKSFYAWIIPLFALSVLNVNCHPVEEVSVSTSREAIAKESTDTATVETSNAEIDFTLSRDRVTESGETETTVEGSTGSESPWADGDFGKDNGITKREIGYGEGSIDDNTTESNDKDITVAESDFIQHDYDYAVKNDFEMREKRFDRFKRQSGESVPYLIPNRSRRDLPVYPANLVPVNENAAAAMQSRNKEDKRRDVDGDGDEDEEEKKEKK